MQDNTNKEFSDRLNLSNEKLAERIELPQVPGAGGNGRSQKYRPKPFDDPRVRNAFSAALDTVGIQKAVFRGVGKTPRTLIPSGIKYSIDADLPVHARDVEAVKKLFAEAGVDPKGLKIEIWTNERKERVDMATIIQAQLQELGIEAKIKVLEWGAYIQGLQKKEHDLFLLGWGLSVPDPDYAVAGLLETGAGTKLHLLQRREAG